MGAPRPTTTPTDNGSFVRRSARHPTPRSATWLRAPLNDRVVFHRENLTVSALFAWSPPYPVIGLVIIQHQLFLKTNVLQIFLRHLLGIRFESFLLIFELNKTVFTHILWDGSKYLDGFARNLFSPLPHEILLIPIQPGWYHKYITVLLFYYLIKLRLILT